MPDNLNDWSPEVWGWKILVACIVMTLALSAVCLSSGNVFVSNCWQQYWLECVSDMLHFQFGECLHMRTIYMYFTPSLSFFLSNSLLSTGIMKIRISLVHVSICSYN